MSDFNPLTARILEASASGYAAAARIRLSVFDEEVNTDPEFVHTQSRTKP